MSWRGGGCGSGWPGGEGEGVAWRKGGIGSAGQTACGTNGVLGIAAVGVARQRQEAGDHCADDFPRLQESAGRVAARALHAVYKCRPNRQALRRPIGARAPIGLRTFEF